MRHVLLWTALLMGLKALAAANSISVSPGQMHAPSLRLLRSDTQPGDEARLAINFSGANKLLDPVKRTGNKITGAIKAETLRFKGIPADDVFVLLKLDQAGDKILENKQFGTWVSYMTKTNKKYPEVAMVAKLTTVYGDEVLAKILQAGVKVKSTNSIARKLQFIQMTGWMQQTNSIDDIFRLLKLDEGMEKLLTSPNLNILERYIEVYNKFNGVKRTSLIKEMMRFYEQKAVSTALEAAKKNPSTNALATELQAAQFRQWFADGVKPPKIWKMLEMKKSTWTLNPDAQVWRDYNAYYWLQKKTAEAAKS
ncbi:hypothetical protein PPTG_07098 [Phytophthora nicotianae INRA-310]|uniref:RxLR effector protein n=1 Tax=Phytophthora nicotianae (strain INRA-310) TaxID=761204 RepID=W2QRH5_PHYN3|nr:hypothetical protein PPTG_07098 [Phytophthora nicotianae INRA-310]ETN14845.1 hypothetical protein PPTG_07098 [Phytophthora nicotianae INRA-310]